MNLEILYTHIDPTVRELQQRTERVLTDLAPYANAPLVRASTRKPASPVSVEHAPALLVDSKIVPAEEPDHPEVLKEDITAATTDTSTPQGTPSQEAAPSSPTIPSQSHIRAHLVQVLLTAGPSAIRFPLVHRRIISIALLLMLVGALSSQFLAAGPVLTYAGLLLLPVGLATNGTRARRQPLMLIAGVLSILSGLLLLWYFGPLLISDSDTATPPSPAIFYTALLGMCAAWGPAVAAVFARRRLRQKLRERLLHTITDAPQ